MAIWASVDGTVKLKNENRKLSIRTSIENSFNSVEGIVVKQGDYGYITFEFCFIDDGISAAKQVDNWVNSIKPRIERLDLDVMLRFVY